MKTPEERRFERIKDILIAESSGSGPVKIASTRTLFGIKSHAEEVIERTVAEMEANAKVGMESTQASELHTPEPKFRKKGNSQND